ncbi:MAG: histidine--tRNA ligase [Bdellovibrionales bacterium]|nr:histidine--tRNA ligase [Bdellovibrionales bacterium]
MSLQSVRGTHDLLFEECAKHRRVEEVLKDLASRFGFREFSTPIFEFSEVFKRTLGDASDIVTKEMYTFLDKGGDSITLRPEGTAGLARAFISEGLTQKIPFKAFYRGPMFRYERPQKGRQRQFHQLGVETLGVPSPLADVESISLANLYLANLGILNRASLEINSLGDGSSRAHYMSQLVTYLNNYKGDLSLESQKRLQINPLRILDSKDPKDHQVLQTAPKLEQSLNDESKAFFEKVCQGLTKLNIAFNYNSHLVRGLDYYSHTVFEYRTSALGAQDAILSGGRYDQLIEMLGGPSTAGFGWAAGVERLVMLDAHKEDVLRPIAIVPMAEESENDSLKLAHDLRENGQYVEIIYSGNLSKRMKKAANLHARWALLVGGDEWSNGLITIKNMDQGGQSQVPQVDLVKFFRETK